MRLIFIILFFISPLLYSTDYNRISEVELIEIYASFNDSVVVINWSTASEDNNKYFIIERASNYPIKEFKSIDTLEALGFSKETNNYSTIDSTIEFGNIYSYRLSTVSFDGTIRKYNYFIALVEVPNVETTVIESDNKQLISYELQEDRIVITTSIPIHNQITLFSLDGRTIHPNIKILNDENYSLDISDLPNGKYILSHNENLICKFVK